MLLKCTTFFACGATFLTNVGNLVCKGDPQLPLELHCVLPIELEVDIGKVLHGLLTDLGVARLDARDHDLKVSHQPGDPGNVLVSQTRVLAADLVNVELGGRDRIGVVVGVAVVGTITVVCSCHISHHLRKVNIIILR